MLVAPASHRTLSIGNLPFHQPPAAVAAELAAACCSARPLLHRVAVSSFTAQGVCEFEPNGSVDGPGCGLRPLPSAFPGGDEPQRRRPRDEHKENRGSALLCFSSAGAARYACAALAAAHPALRLGGGGGGRERLRESLAARQAAAAEAEALAAARAAAAAPHRLRRRARERDRSAEELAAALRCALALPAADCADDSALEAAARGGYSSWADAAAAARLGVLDWSASPAAVDPARGGGLGDTPRAARKRLQVASFLAILSTLAAGRPPGEPLRVVDFGAGTGNLCLPLAWALGARARLSAVDAKRRSIEAVAERAAAAGLPLDVLCGRIEDFQQPLDVALGLHVCGGGTDAVVVAAARCGAAAFLVSPCCVGKLNRGLIPAPRSAALRARLGGDEFGRLAAAADFSGGGGVDGYDSASVRGRLPRAAKAVVEADRAAAAAEAGYVTRLAPLLGGSAVGIKADLIVGWHPQRMSGETSARLAALFDCPDEALLL